jgi:phosphatidylglycerol:prolipoprotein diacylglycerol transferase
MNHFVWNGSPDIFTIGTLTVRWYGLLFASGFLAGYQMMAWLLTKEKHSTEFLDKLLVYLILGAVIGARLAHTLIYEPSIYLADPIRIFKVWEGGLASHGGAVGSLLGAYLWKRKYFKGSFLEVMDYLVMPATIAGAFIRVGNFFNSEIIGRPSELPWAVIFERVNPLPRHPAMLYECVAYILIFFVLLKMFKKGMHRGHEGIILGAYFVLVFTARFFIEFTKEFQVASEANLPLDLGQLLSIPFVLLGIWLIVRSRKQVPVKKRR